MIYSTFFFSPSIPSVCPAEELPFEDASVDLLASFTAAHWFDIEKFMREVSRVVRPGGCVAISTYTVDMSLHYGTCSEKLTQIFREVRDETHASGLPLLAWARRKVQGGGATGWWVQPKDPHPAGDGWGRAVLMAGIKVCLCSQC